MDRTHVDERAEEEERARRFQTPDGRPRKLVIQCSWCRRHRVVEWGGRLRWVEEAEWFHLQPLGGYETSHGICPECLSRSFEPIDESEPFDGGHGPPVPPTPTRRRRGDGTGGGSPTGS